jgi:hypothetical protein
MLHPSEALARYRIQTSSARLSTLGWSPGYGRSNAPAERPSGQPRYQP